MGSVQLSGPRVTEGANMMWGRLMLWRARQKVRAAHRAMERYDACGDTEVWTFIRYFQAMDWWLSQKMKEPT